jgi:hypothetical protein
VRRCALVVLVATTAGCGTAEPGGDITGKTIRYEVEYLGASEDALSHTALNISYSTSDGQQEQAEVSLPWTTVVGTAERGFTASVSAQFNGFGTIMCRIVADDTVIEQRSSTQDAYPVVECRS